ncbi:hypothetical protein FA13DRAFT_271569 [Coprinellus micaceus]|uniref:F-box domain-containing protein n=1 Tax=Coprinellus micaceus TaxID=71717 RepID=A0A4Y7SET3_COPMI|nr:hypothetical protein FA13DRAFT_271569 [Coprinellus micaceus]
MPPTIPDELIQLIIDNLAQETREGCAEDLLSCSLAHNALRHAAQKHLFETVQLWPSPPSLQDPPPYQAALDERALLFVQLLKKNPALGLHVRRLDYQVNQFPRNDEDRLDDLLQAIEMMPNVTDLTLGYRRIVVPWTEGHRMLMAPIPRELVFQNRKGTSGEDPHSRWKRAVVALIQRTQLKTLRLAKIRILPLYSLSPSIRTLYLQDSSFSLDRPLEPFENRCVKLESLNCEDDEAVNFVDDYLKAEEVGLPLPVTLDLSGLRRLGITALCGYHERWGRVLRRVGHLCELEVLGELHRAINEGVLTLTLRPQYTVLVLSSQKRRSPR